MSNSRKADLRLRWAMPADAGALAKLSREFRTETGHPSTHLTCAAILRDGFGAEPQFEVILAEDLRLADDAQAHGSLCGYTLFMPSYEPTYAARGLYIADIYVVPGKRRQGIGRALAGGVASIARDRERSFIWWVVMADNTKARKFYDQIGANSEPMFANAVTRFNVFDNLADTAIPISR